MRSRRLPAASLAVVLVACGGGDRQSPSAVVDGGAPDARTIVPRPDAGGFGAARECYGIADDLREVFAIDPATGQATHLCTMPPGVAEIDAIASHPTTGVYYYASQSDLDLGTFAELGWFAPDTCAFEAIGPLSVTDLAGLSFHPETGDLYAGDQTANAVYRLGRDAAGAPTVAVTHVADLALAPKAIAIEPDTGTLYVSDSDALVTVDLATGAVGAARALSQARVQAIFFDQAGQLYGTVDRSGLPPDRFVKIDPATGQVTDIGGFNPVVYLPDTTARPPANDLEAMDCNVGGACDDCVE